MERDCNVIAVLKILGQTCSFCIACNFNWTKQFRSQVFNGFNATLQTRKAITQNCCIKIIYVGDSAYLDSLTMVLIIVSL